MSQTLEICVSVHNFQRRFCWMCSSIVQQKSDDIPVIRLSVAHMENNGSPTVEDIANYYCHNWGLDFHLVTYKDTEELQYRGIVRNRQIKESDAEWILFADCDMVYTPVFFDHIAKLMGKYKGKGVMLHLGRLSCDIDLSNKAVDSFFYPTLVENVAMYCAGMPCMEMKNCGAGYFQLVERRTLREICHDIYIELDKCKDKSWKRIQMAKSDMQFRRRCPHKPITEEDLIGMSSKQENVAKLKAGVLNVMERPLQFHLNHLRDNQVGHHIEDQR